MLIHYQKPDIALADYIDHFWEKKVESSDDVPYDVETIFPENQINIIFSFGEPYQRSQGNTDSFIDIQGAKFEALHTLPQYFKHSTGVHIFGIKFTFGGLFPLTPKTFKHRSNVNLPLLEIWPNFTDTLYQDLMQAPDFESRCKIIQPFILANFEPQKIKKYQRLKQYCSLVDVNQKFTSSEYKTISRTFLEATGITPKEYNLINRLSLTLSYISQNREISNQEIVDLLGFYDAAHLTNTFKKLTGKTPTFFKDVVDRSTFNENFKAFKQYISPEHLLYYQTEVHQIDQQTK